jgi:hypothetical protein
MKVGFVSFSFWCKRACPRVRNRHFLWILRNPQKMAYLWTSLLAWTTWQICQAICKCYFNYLSRGRSSWASKQYDQQLRIISALFLPWEWFLSQQTKSLITNFISAEVTHKNELFDQTSKEKLKLRGVK